MRNIVTLELLPQGRVSLIGKSLIMYVMFVCRVDIENNDEFDTDLSDDDSGETEEEAEKTKAPNELLMEVSLDHVYVDTVMCIV